MWWVSFTGSETAFLNIHFEPGHFESSIWLAARVSNPVLVMMRCEYLIISAQKRGAPLVWSGGSDGDDAPRFTLRRRVR